MSDVAVIDAEVVRTGTEWAEVIRADLGRAVEGIVSAGKHLIAAKADVQHGEWLPMLREVGIDTGTASRLMQIARNPAIGKSGNCQNFPTALRALHELSQLSPEAIESGIAHGDIHPAMTAKDAKGYAAEVAECAPANVNAETGEVLDETPEPERTALDKEATFVNDLRLYILNIGNSKETRALTRRSKEYLVAYLREAANTIEETL